MPNSILKQELRNLRAELNRQIVEVRKMAQELGIDALAMRDANHNFIMAPLLTAKASVLSALAYLEN